MIAERLLPHDERHDHRRAKPQLTERAPLVGIRDARLEHLVGDLGDELRGAGADDAVGRRLRARRPLPPPLLRELALLRVDVRDGELLEVVARVEELHAAPVRDARHGEIDHLRERRRDVEGRAQRLTDARQVLPGRLGLPALGHVAEHADGEVHAAVAVEDRRRRHRGPALLAGALRPEPHDGGRRLAVQRAAPRQLVGGEGPPVLVRELEPVQDLVGPRREHLLGGREPAELRGGLVRVDERSVGSLRGHAFGDAAQDEVELVARSAHVALVELGLLPRGPLFRGATSRLVGAPLLGEVACDLREPLELARGVLESGDDDRGPEALTVLADAPPLLLVPALASGLGRGSLEAFRRVDPPP